MSDGVLAIERAAFRRLRARLAAVALGLLAAEVGGLALATALVRLRAVVHSDGSSTVRAALAAVGIGGELLLVFASLGFGLAIVAVARPFGGRALFFPAARASAGVTSLGLLWCFVGSAGLLGLLRLLPALSEHTDEGTGRAAALALALTPTLLVMSLLAAGSLAAAALVARGLTPGRALAAGLDHVLRWPMRSLRLLGLHAGLGALIVLGGALVGWRVATLAILPPAVALATLMAVAAFDAALGRDARLATG